MHRLCNVYTTNCPLNQGKGRLVTKKNERTGSGNKDAQLILRLDKAERDEFVALCKELDTTAAREIRHFIRKFMKKNRRAAAE